MFVIISIISQQLHVFSKLVANHFKANAVIQYNTGKTNSMILLIILLKLKLIQFSINRKKLVLHYIQIKFHRCDC